MVRSGLAYNPAIDAGLQVPVLLLPDLCFTHAIWTSMQGRLAPAAKMLKRIWRDDGVVSGTTVSELRFWPPSNEHLAVSDASPLPYLPQCRMP